MSARLRWVSASAVAAWLFAGCGDDSQGESTGGSTSGSTTTSSTGAASTSTSSSGEGSSSGSTGSGSGSEEGSGSTGAPFDEALVLGYCECMIVNCHDPFHDLYGEDDLTATMACREDAATWPQYGESIDEGDFIECRIEACVAAAEDPTSCDAALGGPPCQ